MLELILIFVACAAVGRIAEMDRRSSFGWGLITFLICMASLYIPLPYLRVGIGVLITFVLMIAVGMLRD
jgi:hypothetical protein